MSEGHIPMLEMLLHKEMIFCSYDFLIFRIVRLKILRNFSEGVGEKEEKTC